MVLFHPDYTVGPGVSPDLLTLSTQKDRGRKVLADYHRRWGIAPRPENVVLIAWCKHNAKPDHPRTPETTWLTRYGTFFKVSALARDSPSEGLRGS